MANYFKFNLAGTSTIVFSVFKSPEASLCPCVNTFLRLRQKGKDYHDRDKQIQGASFGFVLVPEMELLLSATTLRTFWFVSRTELSSREPATHIKRRRSTQHKKTSKQRKRETNSKTGMKGGRGVRSQL